MSFADAYLVRMSEIYEDSAVLTLDSDFKIYRNFEVWFKSLAQNSDLSSVTVILLTLTEPLRRGKPIAIGIYSHSLKELRT
jgi:hypothetical protein